MNTGLHKEFLEVVMAKALEGIFATGLCIEAVRVDGKEVLVALHVTNNKGERMIYLGDADLREGGAFTITGMERALNITIGTGIASSS